MLAIDSGRMMQDLRVNTILGTAIASVLGVLGLNTLAESLVPTHYPKAAAYAVVLESETGGAEAVVEQAIDLGTLLASANIAEGLKVAAKCKSCHMIEPGGSGNIGPELLDVYGRNRGSVAGFGYSQAMTSASEPWVAQTLFAFLEAPGKYVVGTSMAFVGVKKPEDRANLIAYLHSLKPGAPALPAPAPVAAPAEAVSPEPTGVEGAAAPQAIPATGAEATLPALPASPAQ